jgi:hypothetical protein
MVLAGLFRALTSSSSASGDQHLLMAGYTACLAHLTADVQGESLSVVGPARGLLSSTLNLGGVSDLPLGASSETLH